jgi:hypothetical protein
MKHADLIKRLIKEVLSTPPKKESCNCGCHSCENVGNKGPVLNENLSARVVMTENMKYHVKNKLAITENTFRYGSQAFLDLWAEARYLYSRDVIHVNEDDKSILTETNLGEYGIYEGQKVPLDMPMLENELGSKLDADLTPGVFMLPYQNLLDNIEADLGKGDLYYEVQQALYDNDLEGVNMILKNYNVFDKYMKPSLNEAIKKKQPALNKPKRGGSKKFYVYVRNPKTKKIKKVSFGDTTGLSAKINNPQARKAFAARHKCAQKTDKTKASYWSCRLPRYAKLLGLKSNFGGYW